LIVTGLAAAGGLAVGYALTPFSTLDRAKGLIGKEGATPLSAWVRIGTDNSVTVIVPHSEMGQGTHTAMPMMLAEELEADWSLVRMDRRRRLAFRMGARAGVSARRYIDPRLDVGYGGFCSARLPRSMVANTVWHRRAYDRRAGMRVAGLLRARC
jgi:hypothetical protein